MNCSVEGCDTKRRYSGLCVKHFRRKQKNGDPNIQKKGFHEPEVERFKRMYVVNEISKCWEWIGSVVPEGYGSFTVSGKSQLAHRWSYRSFVGAIPDGFHIDHLCRVRRCVNPEHLEAVTPKENIRRGDTGKWKRMGKIECRPNG